MLHGRRPPHGTHPKGTEGVLRGQVGAVFRRREKLGWVMHALDRDGARLPGIFLKSAWLPEVTSPNTPSTTWNITSLICISAMGVNQMTGRLCSS